MGAIVIPFVQFYEFSYICNAIKLIIYLLADNVLPGSSAIKTVLNNETDFVFISKTVKDLNQGDDNLVPSHVYHSLDLPLVPAVTIQYRCGDNIGFGKTRYGLLPFRAFTSRIPADARLIYVIADSPTRSIYHAYSNRCSVILSHLGKCPTAHMMHTCKRSLWALGRGW